MATFGQDQTGIGTLESSEMDSNGTVTFFFTPNPKKLKQQDNDPATPRKHMVAQINHKKQFIKIYPINTLAKSNDFLKLKYGQIRTIILMGAIDETAHRTCGTFIVEDPRHVDPAEYFLNELPWGFTHDYRYGLGLVRLGNYLISELRAKTDIDTIIFDNSPEMKLNKKSLHINLHSYQSIIEELERIEGRGSAATRRVKQSFAHNTLALVLDEDETTYSLGRHPHSSLIARSAEDEDSVCEEEWDTLDDHIAKECRKIATYTPEKLPQLRRDIELISLEQLISNFENYLQITHNEKEWQRFFKKNLFALQQVFGMPATLFRDEVTVGGQGLTGSGNKIVDFMFKNTLTDNIALVEIKRPEMPLFDPHEYRKGVYGPHKELNKAITQALDQCFHLQSELPTLKNNERRYDLESYNIRCIVVAGRTPSEDNDKKKSLELFRNNLRSVTIVTYDEILESLRTLHHFLSNEDGQEK